MLRIRCSALSKIMTEPKSKDEVLSVGAKTYIDDLASEFVWQAIFKHCARLLCCKQIRTNGPAFVVAHSVFTATIEIDPAIRIEIWREFPCEESIDRLCQQRPQPIVARGG